MCILSAKTCISWRFVENTTIVRLHSSVTNRYFLTDLQINRTLLPTHVPKFWLHFGQCVHWSSTIRNRLKVCPWTGMHFKIKSWIQAWKIYRSCYTRSCYRAEWHCATCTCHLGIKDNMGCIVWIKNVDNELFFRPFITTNKSIYNKPKNILKNKTEYSWQPLNWALCTQNK